MQVRRRFIGLDTSLSNTGWAIFTEGEPLPRLGSIKLCDGVRRRSDAFIAIHRLVSGWHAEHPIELLAFEQPLLVGHDKLEKLVALYGVIAHLESICAVKHILCMPVSQHDWRPTFLGPDRAKDSARLKRAAIERARQYGCAPADHDQAEALGVLTHAMLDYRVTPPWCMAHPFLPSLSLA